MADAAEFIIVCIDNSKEAYIKAQFDAVKHYCKTKLAANPKTRVILFTMGSNDSRSMLRATSDYKKIKRYLPSISIGYGVLEFRRALCFATPIFVHCPPNKQKRMLFFVGGLSDMSHMNAVRYGSRMKALGIAVDVVNFYLGERPKYTHISNQYGRMELDAFVDAANSEGNSHIEHVEPGSSIRQVLSKSILRKTLGDSRIKTDDREKAKGKNHFIIRKTKHHKKAKGKNHAAGDVQTEALSPENDVVKLGKGKANSAV